MPQPFYPRLTSASEQTLKAMWSLGELEIVISRVLGTTLGGVRFYADLYFLPARVKLKPKRSGKPKTVEQESYEESMELPLDPWPLKVRFENITKAEARAIIRSAPCSGRFGTQPRYSLTGSSAQMCACA